MILFCKFPTLEPNHAQRKWHASNGISIWKFCIYNFLKLSSLQSKVRYSTVITYASLLCKWSERVLFFLQINSNGRELKLMTSDQKIVRVSLAETVSLIFMSCSTIFIQAWAAHTLCPLIFCKYFCFPLSDFQGHLLF